MSYEQDVLNALETLIPPGEMPQIYKKYAAGFESMKSKKVEQQIALRTIAILAQTTGLIRKETLLTALALDVKEGQPNPKTYKDLNEEPVKVVRTCKHLIDFNENLGVFRFCHVSVFEFFRWNNPTMDHSRIACLCLAHLCSPDFSKGPYSDVEWYNYGSLRPVLQKHPFLEFASCNWATSVRKSKKVNAEIDIQGNDTIMHFIEQLFRKAREKEGNGNLQLSFQVYLLAMGRSMPAGVCHEHIMSYFALRQFFEVFSNKGLLDLSRRDDEGLTAIHWAIRNEMEHDEGKKETALVIKDLIKHGGDVNAQDDEGRTPLYYASHYGNQYAVRLLLDKGADLEIKSKDNDTALIATCRKHHEQVISLLVEAGADVRVQGSAGTALQAISLIGCCDCGKLILGQYGEGPITENGGPFGTPLHAAAFHGHLDILKILCIRLDIHTTNETHGSVLTVAATGWHPGKDPVPFSEIFRELIRRGVNVNDPSGECGPALRAAAFHGNTELVRLLLESGAKVSLAKGPMGTAYQAADDRGHEEVKRLLLESDLNAAAYGKDDAITPLYTTHNRVQREMFKAALKASNMATIHILVVQYERFIDREIKRGQTPFLKSITNLGKNCFDDTISFATTTASKSRREHTRTETSVVKKRTTNLKDEEVNSKEGATLLYKLSTCLCCGSATEKEVSSNQIPVPVALPYVPRNSGMKRYRIPGPPFWRGAPMLKRKITVKHHPEATTERDQLRSTDTKNTTAMTQPKAINPAFSFSRRDSSFFVRDTLEGRFPEVLDQLTRAAVRILERVISMGDVHAVKLITETWLDGLKNLVSCADFGEPMLERIVQSRAVELRKHLTDPELDADERYKKAEDLAKVGIELLVTAVGRGPAFTKISAILAKLWVAAVSDVDDLGEQGQAPVRGLIRLFVGRLSTFVTRKDRINAEICWHAGLELLKAAALSPKRNLFNKFSEECTRQWKFALDEQMGDLAYDMFKRRRQEYQICITNNRYEEALGLAVAGLEVLRAAIEQRFGTVVQLVLPAIDQLIRWTIEQTPKTCLQGEPGGLGEHGGPFIPLCSLSRDLERRIKKSIY